MAKVSTIADGDSKPFWQAAASHRLVFQKCTKCEAAQFPPRHQCAGCWDEEPAWVESAGTGTVESFTIVRRAPVPAFRGEVPYVVAAVWVDEGFRMITNLVGPNCMDVGIGDRVRVDFAEAGDDVILPRFRRDGA